MQAIHVVYEQHARDLTKVPQLFADQVEEKFKERMKVDRAKIDSLEAALASLRIDKVKYEELLAAKDTALGVFASTDLRDLGVYRTPI